MTTCRNSVLTVGHGGSSVMVRVQEEEDVAEATKQLLVISLLI